MKTKLDTKSIALGFLSGIVAAVTIGAVQKPSAGPLGRFQISAGANHAYLVDTITGQVWRSPGSSTPSNGFADPKIDAQ